MRSAQLFPMFLELSGRPCLVVGAGKIAESKITIILQAEAKVRVIARETTAKIRSWARSNRVEWQQREFQLKDLEGMFLVVGATSSKKLHEQIYAEAARLGVLCNIVDVPTLCDFYYPAVVQRGALQIAISTAGKSPALAQRLRKELERQFGPEYEEWLSQLGQSREKLKSQRLDPEQRKRFLHEQASEKAFEKFRRKHKKSKRKH